MPATITTPIRLGAVSYLNTLPLIEGLGKLPDVSLTLTAPSGLIDLLMEREVDLALASIIDAQRAPDPVVLIPAGMIGSDGSTLTVRFLSKRPIETTRRVHADADSHTSIALLRIILAERHNLRPEVLDHDTDSTGETPESLLLIGDKVISFSRADPDAAPRADEYPHQLDLGEAWKELTGLPFVYAVWMCREADAYRPEISLASAILDRARRHNATRLDWIAAARAPARAWPPDLAAHYLRDLLRYNVTPEHARSIDLFFEFAARHGIIDERRPVRWFADPAAV